MSDLHNVPPAVRRRMATLLLPPAVVLLIAGLAPLIWSSGWVWKLIGIVVLVVACLLVAIAFGLRRSATIDASAAQAERYEADVDAAIMAATACGSDCGSSCGSNDCAVRSLPRNEPLHRK